MTERWNPDEPTQFFWLDDAFGVTQYEDVLVDRWNHVLPQIRTMLRKGAKIVMTSRDYIYNRARSDLKETAFPLLQESQVVIDVHDLSDEEKRHILYNHLKLGRQPVSFRTEIKPHLEIVAIHKRFIPETARRLSDPLFTRELSVDPHCLDQFIEKREQFLHEVLKPKEVLWRRRGRHADHRLSDSTGERVGRRNTGESPERSSRELGNVEVPEQTPGTRSIFDDIDA